MTELRPLRPGRLLVGGCPEGFDARYLAEVIARADGPVIHVARDDARLASLRAALRFFAPELPVLAFPAWDCLPYDRVSPNPEIVAERIAGLTRLLEPATAPRIVLTTVNALVQRVPPREVFRGAFLRLAKGGTVDQEALVRFLEANGYGRAGTVMELPDVDLADWLTGRRPVPEGDEHALLRTIAAEALARGAGR